MSERVKPRPDGVCDWCVWRGRCAPVSAGVSVIVVVTLAVRAAAVVIE